MDQFSACDVHVAKKVEARRPCRVHGRACVSLGNCRKEANGEVVYSCGFEFMTESWKFSLNYDHVSSTWFKSPWYTVHSFTKAFKVFCTIGRTAQKNRFCLFSGKTNHFGNQITVGFDTFACLDVCLWAVWQIAHKHMPKAASKRLFY